MATSVLFQHGVHTLLLQVHGTDHFLLLFELIAAIPFAVFSGFPSDIFKIR
jgi:hypothetical protein